MNIHSLAKTTPITRARIVDLVTQHDQPASDVAQAYGISVRTVFKWLKRFREQGAAGLYDRSSAPHRRPRKLGQDILAELIRLRWLKLTGKAIARRLKLARSTVSIWLRRLCLSRARDINPQPPVVRYERSRPGELLHLDVKKLRQFDHTGRRFIDAGGRRQRGSKLECVHVCIDDHSRYAYVEILPREDGATCCEFLERAVAHFAKLGVACSEVMTDNGTGYRSHKFRACVEGLQLRHILTRVRRPQTNGKAERFIQTLSRCWAYIQPYESSVQRNRLLPVWLAYYNHLRTHSALGDLPPISRL